MCQHAVRLLGKDRTGIELFRLRVLHTNIVASSLAPYHISLRIIELHGVQASSITDAQENWPKPGPWCICMWAYASYLSKVSLLSFSCSPLFLLIPLPPSSSPHSETPSACWYIYILLTPWPFLCPRTGAVLCR